jgi:malonate-semialdehyde dehydrogenase (acetylating)/methylmalonate-semialdehyde dehydrogenase
MSSADTTVAEPRADVRRLENYVGGTWRSVEGEALTSRNPATGEPLGEVPLSSADEVGLAVDAARAAQREWAETPILARTRAVFALRETLVAHKDEIAALVTRDMGKTIADATAEVGRGIESVESACAMPHLMKGETLEQVARGVDVEMVRQPVGVVAAISPFNFPAMIPLWFLPFAVATGNTIVLKPSEQDPLPTTRIIELLDELDAFPPGVVNLVHGGRDAVNTLLTHPGVDAVSFVGSAAVARHVAETATAHGKRVQALGGAKNSMVCMPDADRDLLVNGLLGSAFGAAGQRCLAGSVAVLVGSEAQQDETLEAIVAGARELVTGDGADADTDVCPLISPAARERLESALETAIGEGAEVVLDGRMGGGPSGSWLGPTIVDRVDPQSQVATEELFGPLLSLIRVPDLDGALEFLNASRYGNAAVLFTADGGTARTFRREAQAGMLGVNVGVAAPVAWFPFAGWKDSFVGDLHANGFDAIDFYTRKKVVTGRW